MSTEVQSNSIELTVDSMDPKGFGLAHFDGRRWQVRGRVMPGDRARCRIIKKTRRHCEAVVETIIESKIKRIASPCPHFGECGGCQSLDVSYDDQLGVKQDMVAGLIRDSFPSILPKLYPIIGSEQTQFHRNKMEYSFGVQDGAVIVGLKKRGQFDTVVPVPKCLLMSPEAQDILTYTADYFTKLETSTWDHRAHTGLLRYLVLRHSKSRDHYLVNLVVSKSAPDITAPFINAVMETFSSIVSGHVSVQDTISDTAFTEDCRLVAGDPVIFETLGDFTFSISPYSFFQTHSHQAAQLYSEIRAMTPATPTDVCLDLYCGTGTIGLYLSKSVARVVGIEENSFAVQNAKANASANKVINAQFIEGRVKNILKFQSFDPQVVIVDPPRSGMVPKALKRVIALDAPAITYVSCNPKALITDLELILSAGYKVTGIQPVDMFPHTHHVECIVSVVKSNF